MSAYLSTSNVSIDVSYSASKKINRNIQDVVYEKTVDEVGEKQSVHITRELESIVFACTNQIDILVYDNIVHHLYNNFATSIL